MELIVSDYGSFLGKRSERLVLRLKGEVVQEVPFHDLEQIVIMTSGVSMSTDLIQECMEHGININFLSCTGKPYAKLVSPYLTGTVMTRREQLLSYYDTRSVALGVAFVEGKLKNQGNLLKYFAKYRKEIDGALFDQLQAIVLQVEGGLAELKELRGKSIDEVRAQLLSIEGRAGNAYWEGIKLITSSKVNFPGREHQGTNDPTNACLNYGYGILYQQAETALILAGLDIFAGFIHVDRPGKTSLVYDFMEEFRQPVVDRAIIAAINKGWEPKMVEGRLTDETRRDLAAKIRERLDSAASYQGKKYKIRTILQMQARRIATFVRGEAKYKPFVCGW